MNVRRGILFAVLFLAIFGALVVFRRCTTEPTRHQERLIEQGMKRDNSRRRGVL